MVDTAEEGKLTICPFKSSIWRGTVHAHLCRAKQRCVWIVNKWTSENLAAMRMSVPIHFSGFDFLLLSF